MAARKFSGSRGQGALEYLLLIGGAVLIAAVAITLVASSGAGGVKTTKTSKSAFSSSFDDLSALAGQYNCYSSNTEPFNVYLINADAPSMFETRTIDSAQLVTLIGTDPSSGLIKSINDAKGVTINVTQVTSAWDLNSRLNDAPKNSIFINLHGTVVPIPGHRVDGTDQEWIYGFYGPSDPKSYAPMFDKWFNFIADRIDKGKYVWVSTADYPFFWVGNNDMVHNTAGSWDTSDGKYLLDKNGARAFLDQFEPYSIEQAGMDFWPSGWPTVRPYDSKITDAGKVMRDCWGISGLPDSIRGTRPAPAGANPKSNQVFYVDTVSNEQSVEYVKIGGGYFVHVGIDANAEVHAKVSLVTALQAAAVNNQK